MTMNLLAVPILLLCGSAFAQSGPVTYLGWDGPGGNQPQAYHSGQFILKVNTTPETKLVAQAKAAIVEVLIVVKWDDVPDANLPIDAKKIPAIARAMIESLSPEELAAFEKQNKMKVPRVSRDALPAMSAIGSGTGFIVRTADGRVVGITNAHVVQGAEEVSKKLGAKASLHLKLASDKFAHNPDAGDLVAEVGAVGKHGNDVAFLKIPASRADGSSWSTLELADSDTVDEGEEVWALGFPMGLNFTASHGIVSAAHATLDNPYVSYIQTDAAINPGNSGGPLVRMGKNGSPEVIGMDTQILSESGGSMGLGFAIESNSIKRALGQYARSGSIDVGYVGMVFGMGKGADKNKIVVQSVTPGGPAAKAGVKPGDVVVDAGGAPVAANPETGMFQVSKAVKAKDPGETVALGIERKGRSVALKITVEKEPADLPKAPAKTAKDDSDDDQ